MAGSWRLTIPIEMGSVSRAPIRMLLGTLASLDDLSLRMLCSYVETFKHTNSPKRTLRCSTKKT